MNQATLTQYLLKHGWIESITELSQDPCLTNGNYEIVTLDNFFWIILGNKEMEFKYPNTPKELEVILKNLLYN